MKKIGSIVLSALILSLLVGCPPKGPMVDAPKDDYNRKLSPGQMGLAKIDPSDPRYPDFTPACGDLKDMRQAVLNSINYMNKPSSKVAYLAYGPEFPHDRALASLQAFLQLIDSNQPSDQMNREIREKFDVYISVGWNMKGDVLFTGYYTPIFKASATPTDVFKYPIYKQPADLQKGPDGQPLSPYPARAELVASGKLKGLELYYLADEFEAYIAQVQGSAKLELPDGRQVMVGYAANNGHDYVSVGKMLIEEKKLSAGQMSLRGMMDYFKAHPNEVKTYVDRNPRFVFFTEQTGEPRGCLNEPVTAWRTLATDKSIFPRACVTFFSANMPRRGGNLISMVPYTGFSLDQDAGGAIRAPGRCDVYMGVGPEAGELAGRTQEKGHFYYLLLKPGAAPVAPITPAAPSKPAAPTSTALPPGTLTPPPIVSGK